MQILYSAIAILVAISQASSLNSVWRWECEQNTCQKKSITPNTTSTALSLSACQLFCSQDGALWPRPTGSVSIGNYLVKLNPNSIDVLGANTESASFDLTSAAIKIFKKQIHGLIPNKRRVEGGMSMEVHLVIANPKIQRLELDTDESYTLYVSQTSDGRMNATVLAANYFGGRHGLETLNQLIIFDDLRDEIQVPKDVIVADAPAYPHRGILLDTARNFISVEAIKRTLNGMGANKLNSFHWHITDSQSFPYVSSSLPDLSKYGAYKPTKVYSPNEIEDVIRYGLERGVKVIPEFDAPAHVGEGWQNSGLVVCFNKKPWSDFCVEPPCGQFDPTLPQLYDQLELLYGDLLTQFQPDIFHMGGDEVHFGCWNSTESIVQWMATQGWGRSEEDFVKLWDHFQTQALERVYKKAGRQLPIVMWTSTLTEEKYVRDFLPNDKYIIQIWTTGADKQVSYLLENDYKLILSNYDALYFDCGFAGWVTDGNNWCSPYIGWQKVYDNRPANIAGERKKQILGAEATLWTEQVDSETVDSRLWPRAAAMAEVFWTEPEGTWRQAESRFLIQRERLVALGIASDALEPEWCLQNEENCPTGGPIIEHLDDTNGNVSMEQTTHLLFIMLITTILLLQ